MKKNLVWFSGIVIALAVVFAMSTTASAILFDFEGVSDPGNAAAIEAYMEGIYGSDITVTHGIVGDGILHGPLGPDHYIQVGPSYGTHWFSISFNEVPITSVSFDWGVEYDRFHAYADGVEFFSKGYGYWSYGNSGTYYFTSPVTTLKFSDGFLGAISIDNLNVTPASAAPIPEPATLFLLGSGLIGIAGIGRRKFKKGAV